MLEGTSVHVENEQALALYQQGGPKVARHRGYITPVMVKEALEKAPSSSMTDSKLPDAQAGYEKMATLPLATMGGCNHIHHAISMVTT